LLCQTGIDDYFAILSGQGKQVNMKQAIVLLFIISALRVPAQQKHTAVYFDDSRAKTKEKLAQYLKFYGMQGEMQETDSTIALRTGLPGSYAVTFTYYFDDKGKCSEYRYSNCDTCVRKYLSDLLAKKQYGWIQVDDTHYLSKSSNKMLLSIVDHTNDFSYRVRRVKKAEYRALLTAAAKN
jgi:hypothetical protein